MPQQIQKTPHSVSAHPRRRVVLPTWTCTFFILAFLIAGLLISIEQQSIGLSYLLLFGAGAALATLLVVPEGIWLTVAQIPLLFGITTPISAWVIQRAHSLNGEAAFSTTGLITAVYPLMQHFPALLATFLGCLVIGIFRVFRINSQQHLLHKRAQAERRRIKESDQRNTATSAQARRMSTRPRRQRTSKDDGKLTVFDLAKRNGEATPKHPTHHALPETPTTLNENTRPRQRTGDSAQRRRPITDAEREARLRRNDELRRHERRSLNDDRYSTRQQHPHNDQQPSTDESRRWRGNSDAAQPPRDRRTTGDHPPRRPSRYGNNGEPRRGRITPSNAPKDPRTGRFYDERRGERMDGFLPTEDPSRRTYRGNPQQTPRDEHSRRPRYNDPQQPPRDERGRRPRRPTWFDDDLFD